MDDHPAEQLESVTGIPKNRDETVKEYVERVGNTYELREDVLTDGVEYITEWQYSEADPANPDRYERFLQAIQATATTPEGDDTGETGLDPNSSGSESDTDPTVTDDSTVSETVTIDGSTDTDSPAQQGFRSGLEGKEPRKLFLRFVVIVLTAPILGWLMGRAWVPGHQLYDAGQQGLAQILGIDSIRAIELVSMFALGLYLALLAVFIFDIKKRVQGMLLLAGSAMALGVLATMGVFLPNIEYDAPLNILGITLGLGVGIFIESGQLLALDWARSTFQRPTLETGEVPEFRFAAILLFVLLSGAVVLSVLQAVLADVIRVYDIAAAGVFLVMLGQFIQYESETNYMTLGPERAGKSMLMLGLSLELRDSETVDPQPNEYLQRGLEQASNIQSGDMSWPIPSTSLETVEVASFEVISGYYFPRRLQLSALDYAGQHLGRVADLFESEDVDADAASVPQEIAEWLTDADTLLFILDVERLVYPDKFQDAAVADEANVSWGLEHYSSILEHTDPADIIVVATKCDILIDQGRVALPSEYDSFDGFRQAVTEDLSSRPDVERLLSTAGESTIQPVYFATERRGTEYVPVLDDAGNLTPVGYDHLIDELRSRQ